MNYLDITPVMYRWKLNSAVGTPVDAIHKGTIKYLKKKSLE